MFSLSKSQGLHSNPSLNRLPNGCVPHRLHFSKLLYRANMLTDTLTTYPEIRCVSTIKRDLELHQDHHCCLPGCVLPPINLLEDANSCRYRGGRVAGSSQTPDRQQQGAAGTEVTEHEGRDGGRDALGGSGMLQLQREREYLILPLSEL